jgi:hypothetical protein
MFEKYNEHIEKTESGDGDMHPLFKEINKKTPKESSNLSKPSNNKLLSEYFKIDYVYLSFMDSNDVSSDLGSNEIAVYYLNTNTGKVKVTSEEYLKFTNIFNADLNVVPHEYVIIILIF